MPRNLPFLKVDGKNVTSSDEILEITNVPKSLLVLGAGAVGVEFASMYHDLGTRVSLLEYLPAIVPLEDREVSQALERSFTRRGIRVGRHSRLP